MPPSGDTIPIPFLAPADLPPGTPILAEVGPSTPDHPPSFYALLPAPYDAAVAIHEAPSEYSFKREAHCWRKSIVVAFGERVEFLWMGHSDTPMKHVTIPLDGYVSDLLALSDILLVASAVSVRCILPLGDVLWTSEPIAVDGIRFLDLDETRLRLSAECDPPGGWRTVDLDLATGRRLP